MNVAIGATLVAILLIGGIAVARGEEAGSAGGTIAGHRPAKATIPAPGYYDQQLLNYRYSEFCSVMRRPPNSLIEAIDNSFSTEEGKKSPAVIEGFTYLHILDQMVRERCGDA